MKAGWWIRFSLLVSFVVLSIGVLVPTFVTIEEDSYYPFKSKINLGLDLQGGLYMILGIDFNKVYEDEIRGYARKSQLLLKDKKIEVEIGNLDSSNSSDPTIEIIVDPSKREEALGHIKSYYSNFVRIVQNTDNKIGLAMGTTAKLEIESQAANKSIEVIRNRIDEFGVTEPEIVTQGKDRIVIQLPGVKDINKAKELIGQTAKLEFKIVNSDVSQAQVEAWIGEAKATGIVYEKGTGYNQYLKNLYHMEI